MGKFKTKELLLHELEEMHRQIAELERLRKQAEEEKEAPMTQLQQVQELERIGTIAGTIAHDFNNILGNITGYAELALTHYCSPDSPMYECLEEILRAAERAKVLVARIAALSCQSVQEEKSK